MLDGEPYETGSKIWGPWRLNPKEIGGPKTSKFGANFGQLRNSIENISGMQQDIVERKMRCKLAYNCVCMLNLVNFGPQTAKTGPEFPVDRHNANY